MFGSTTITGRQAAMPTTGALGDPDRLAHALAQTLGAPIGLLDPGTGVWVARSGPPGAVYPEPREVSVRIQEGAAALPGARVMTWRPDASSTGGMTTVWLLMTLSLPSGRLVAAAGFRGEEGHRGEAESPWGPACPEPALLAWGREIVERLRASSSRLQSRTTAGAAADSQGGEGVVLARLIRRMRLSDAPERFQHLACNALRASLGVQAVAWVPCHHAEAVVASGEAGRIRGEAFRSLIPSGPSTESVQIWNEPEALNIEDLRQLILVATDLQRPSGWLVAVNTLDGRPFRQSDAELLQPVASVISTQQHNARGYGDLKELLFGVIRSLTSAIDAKDPYTSGHSERVARIAVRLAEELGVPPAQRSDLYLMGLLHDVGKIGVDDAVLKKAGPLTPDEYRQIQRHVEIGVQILADLKKLAHLIPGIRGHHESLDGTGYPDGLAGDAIPFEARILAVADSYDAMSSTRPYRRRLTPSQIDEIFRKGSGSQWDPRIVEAMFACRMDLETIRQKGLGESLQVAVSGALGRA